MKRSDEIAVACIVAIIVIAFGDILFLDRTLYFRDLTRADYPAKKVLHDIVWAGEFPSWNPYDSSGQPLAANPYFAVFYPGQLLLFIPDVLLGLRLTIVLHVLIAALGMFALLRVLGSSVYASVFGSLAFGMGGLVLSTANLLPYLYGTAWTPWVALATYLLLEEPTRPRFVWAAMAFALQVLAGEPMTVLMCGVAAVAYATVQAVRRKSSVVRSAAIIVLVGGVACAIAAVQAIPALDLVRDTVRSRKFTFEEAARLSTPPIKLSELFVPGTLGPASQHAAFYWGTAKYGWLDPFYLSIYFGLLPMSLIVTGIAVREKYWTVVVGVAAIAALLAFGSHTPLLRMLHAIGALSIFRYPEKFLLFVIFPLTLFSAFVFDRTLDDRRRMSSIAAIVASIVAAVCVVLAFVSLSSSYPMFFARFWGIEVHPLAKEMAEASTAVWLSGVLRAFAVAALLLLAPHLSHERWSAAAIALLAIDLGFARRSVAESISARLLRDAPPLVRIVQSDARVFHQASWFQATTIARRYFDTPEAYWIIRNGLFPQVGSIWGIRYALSQRASTGLLVSEELKAAMGDLRQRMDRWYEPVMAFSNAGYRALYIPFEEALRRAGDDHRTIQPTVLVPFATNPRYYFADRIIPSRSRSDFVDLIARGQWTSRAAFADLPASIPAGGRVLSVSESSNGAHIRAHADGDALLVVSITSHRYWRAFVDGREAPLIPVNIAYQAIRLPAGSHEVRLQYRNPLFLWCGLLSLIALGGTLFVGIMPLRDRAE